MQITITGIDELINRLGQAQSNDVLRTPMIAALALLQGRLATYPSPPENSSYRRTTTLGPSWNMGQPVSLAGGGIQGVIGTKLTYAPYVMGHGQQARIHQGRWPTEEQIAREEEGRIRALFADAISKALG